jgi:hypothetical protein
MLHYGYPAAQGIRSAGGDHGKKTVGSADVRPLKKDEVRNSGIMLNFIPGARVSSSGSDIMYIVTVHPEAGLVLRNRSRTGAER